VGAGQHTGTYSTVRESGEAATAASATNRWWPTPDSVSLRANRAHCCRSVIGLQMLPSLSMTLSLTESLDVSVVGNRLANQYFARPKRRATAISFWSRRGPAPVRSEPALWRQPCASVPLVSTHPSLFFLPLSSILRRCPHLFPPPRTLSPSLLAPQPLHKPPNVPPCSVSSPHGVPLGQLRDIPHSQLRHRDTTTPSHGPHARRRPLLVTGPRTAPRGQMSHATRDCSPQSLRVTVTPHSTRLGCPRSWPSPADSKFLSIKTLSGESQSRFHQLRPLLLTRRGHMQHASLFPARLTHRPPVSSHLNEKNTLPSHGWISQTPYLRPCCQDTCRGTLQSDASNHV